MAKNIFTGVNNTAQKAKSIYVGVNNTARKVKEVYAGVGGVARKVWPNNLIPDDRYQSVTSIGVKKYDAWLTFYPNLDSTFVPYPLLRCVIKFSLFDTSTAISRTEDTTYRFGRFESFISYGYLYSGNDHAVIFRLGYEHTGSYTSGNMIFNVEHAKNRSDTPVQDWITSYTSEDMIIDNIYTIDFLNNYATYIDSQKGYYSNPSNRYIGSITASKVTPPINNMYDGSYYYTGIQFGMAQYVLGKIYSVKFYKNNTTLIRDYIPGYRISDGYLGMYDTVNHVFLEAYHGRYDPVISNTEYYVVEE